MAPGLFAPGGNLFEALAGQVVLRSEVAIQRHLVGIGGLGNRVDTNALDALLAKQLDGAGHDAGARRHSAAVGFP